MKLTKQVLKNLILEMMEPLDPEMKANLLQLLNGEDDEDQRQGIDLADMLVPELMDKVDAMPQLALFSEPPSAESFLNIIRTRIQEQVARWDRFKGVTAFRGTQDYVDRMQAKEDCHKAISR